MSIKNLPAAYTKAQKALAHAVKVEQLSHITKVAEGMEVLAIKAKDGTLAGDAAEIKIRATRKIGLLIKAEREMGKLAKGGAEKGVGRRGKNAGSRETRIPTLDERGVDKNLAHRARALESFPEPKFESEVVKVRRFASAAAEGNHKIVQEARAERTQAKKQRRKEREVELAEKIEALPDREFGILLADPEWLYETWSEEGMDRAAANHYPVSPTDEIMMRDVPSICADDCVLFLWATVPMLPAALAVMKAWDFNYVSHFVWIKDRTGTGYWNRNKHELLLIGTRGDVVAPAPGTQYDSVIKAPRGKHSAKPDEVYEIIEHYFPNVSKIELNARRARDGWARWGQEAPAEDAAE